MDTRMTAKASRDIDDNVTGGGPTILATQKIPRIKEITAKPIKRHLSCDGLVRYQLFVKIALNWNTKNN